ncbi:MAG: serine/threonine protein kinase [Bifidobacterium tibiigranuli]|uniref:serine/threonine-protein kinase n=1 Tax=Bifidobacterium tibiigranuli TaxID=2172043 RepID=UPI0026EAD490|nr:serine/threonine-protein kinase [Bifidobacterium tibiigranuli]MCI1674546.1 serine/threonine protein kinase [Bifidobacterium tibiigranuli]MCI1713008.1 serine/threonine protein kinase [Bifidobacterium tibiigranuli]
MNQEASRATTGSDPRPPTVPGYACTGRIASGSSAVVYRLHRTGRAEAGIDLRLARAGEDIAVKVGKRPVRHDGTDLMRREAQCLAALCPHPNILACHAAGVTQEGHGYLVLDYAALGSCRKRLRAKAFEADEALSMGIALACALATAHRAGYLHRDIKPSNVLIAASGTPLLADFGICTSVYQPEDSPGFSLPWAPPEVASQASPGSEAGDIYSLAATLFALLCGQSPYEYAYRPRSHSELVRVMLTSATPVLDAEHAPSALSRALHVAMSQDPGDRFVSALDFARALQHAQFTCFHHVTPLVVDGAAPVPAELKCCIDADSHSTARMRVPELTQAAPCPSTSAHASTTPRPSSSRALPPQLGTRMPPPRNRRTRSHHAVRTAMPFGAAMFVLIFVLAAALAHYSHAPPLALQRFPGYSRTAFQQPNRQSTSNDMAKDETNLTAEGTPISPPHHVTGSISGDAAVFRWTNPDPHEGDAYAWTPTDPDDEDSDSAAPATTTSNSTAPSPSTITKTTTVTLPRDPQHRRCIQVSIIRSSHRMSQRSPIACAPYP